MLEELPLGRVDVEYVLNSVPTVIIDARSSVSHLAKAFKEQLRCLFFEEAGS